MFVADDEDQTLRLYDRSASGLPVAGFDVTANLGLTDFSGGLPREVDIEGSAQGGSRIYWLASHANSAAGANRPNRSRLFATDISGAGATSTLTYVGRYDGLKTDLINWDSTNGHGLGANFFGLTASATFGVIPEAADGVVAASSLGSQICHEQSQIANRKRTRGQGCPRSNFPDFLD